MLRVGSLSGLSAALPLSTSQRAVLEGGGILITDPILLQDGKVNAVGGTATKGPSDNVTGAALTQHTQFSAALVEPLIWEKAFRGQTNGVWMLRDTAARLGWPVRIESVNLTSPTGTISPEVERALADRLGDGYLLLVERGFQNPYWLILLILFSVAGLLVLIASLISTALSLAESQNDMATLAAVGATRHTRRGIAACQAWVVAACGCPARRGRRHDPRDREHVAAHDASRRPCHRPDDDAAPDHRHPVAAPRGGLRRGAAAGRRGSPGSRSGAIPR